MRVTLSARRVGFHLSDAGHAESYAERLSISGKGAEGEPLPFEMMEQSRNRRSFFGSHFFAATITSAKAARLLAFFRFDHYHCERCE